MFPYMLELATKVTQVTLKIQETGKFEAQRTVNVTYTLLIDLQLVAESWQSFWLIEWPKQSLVWVLYSDPLLN